MSDNDRLDPNRKPGTASTSSSSASTPGTSSTDSKAIKTAKATKMAEEIAGKSSPDPKSRSSSSSLGTAADPGPAAAGPGTVTSSTGSSSIGSNSSTTATSSSAASKGTSGAGPAGTLVNDNRPGAAATSSNTGAPGSSADSVSSSASGSGAKSGLDAIAAADRRKSEEQAQTIRDKARQTGEKLKSEAQNTAHHVTGDSRTQGQAGSRLGDSSAHHDYQTDREDVGKLGRLVQQRPGVFLAGAVVCGFLLARFLRSGPSDQYEYEYEYELEGDMPRGRLARASDRPFSDTTRTGSPGVSSTGTGFDPGNNPVH